MPFRQFAAGLFFVAGLLLLPTALQPANAQAQIDEAQAKSFAEAMFNEAVSSFAGPALPLPERDKRLRALIAKYGDPSLVGKDVTGRYWEKAESATRDVFPQLLVDYVVANYKKSLQDIEPKTKFAAKEFQTEGNRAMVSGEVTAPNDEPSPLSVIMTKSGDRLVATDLIVDGVSVIRTMREEFVSVLRANSGEMNKLMDVMKAKIALADKE